MTLGRIDTAWRGHLAVALVVLATLVSASAGWAALRVGEAEDHTVVLVPGREWTAGGELVRAGLMRGEIPAGDTVLLARGVGGDPMAQVVFATVSEAVEPSQVVEPSEEPMGKLVRLGNAVGRVGRDGRSGFVWLEVTSGGRSLTLWTDPATTSQALVDLAGMIDLRRPVEEQSLGFEWRVVTTADSVFAGTERREFTLRRVRGDGQVDVVTRTGVDDLSLWFVGAGSLGERAQVRGKPGLVVDDTQARTVTVAWLEEPGVLVELHYAASGPDRVAAALTMARHLVPVGESTWRGFVSRLPDDQGVIEPPVIMADPDEDDERVELFSGALADGRSYRIEERDGVALCAPVSGTPPIDWCDTDHRVWRDWSLEALPRHVGTGDATGSGRSPVVLYGYLPERVLEGETGRVQSGFGQGLPIGRAVRVEVEDSRGRALGNGSINGDVWSHFVPNTEFGLVVTYHFIDGGELVVMPRPRVAAADSTIE